MKRGLGIVMVLAILSLSLHGLIGGVVAQDATPTVDPAMIESAPITAADCEGITEYARILVTLGASLAAASYGLPATSVAQWSDEIYSKFIEGLTLAIEKLTGATPPEAAQKLNDYAIVALKAVQSAVVFIRTSGLAANLPFVDQLDKVDDVITQIIATLETACPGLSSELGTPVASPAAA